MRLAEELRRHFPDAVFVITGTRNERFLARRFAETMEGVIDLTGKTSVSELTGIIEALDLFITQDCGVLHVAAATSTPLLSLFGPTCPAATGPWPLAAHHRILQRASMTEITPSLAVDAAVELLQQLVGVRQCAESTVKKTLEKLIVASVLWLPEYDLLNNCYVVSSCAGLL